MKKLKLWNESPNNLFIKQNDKTKRFEVWVQREYRDQGKYSTLVKGGFPTKEAAQEHIDCLTFEYLLDDFIEVLEENGSFGVQNAEQAHLMIARAKERGITAAYQIASGRIFVYVI